MNKYIKLANVTSSYAVRMRQLGNRIFGEVARPTNNKSMKVIKILSEKPVNKNSDIINYYPRLEETNQLMKNLRLYGLFRDEHEDFREEMERLRILRGKGRWKKKSKKQNE